MKKTISITAICIAIALFIAVGRPTTATSSAALTTTNTTNTNTTIIVNGNRLTLPTLKPLPTFPTRVVAVTPKPTTKPTVTATATVKPSASTTATQMPTTSATPTTTPAATQSTNSYVDEVIKLVNNERSKVGLKLLTENSSLERSAQSYAEYMATENFFSHDGLDGSTFVTRNKSAGYTNYRWMGENIAAGQRSPSEVMNAWMNSPGHKANILNSNAKEIGVGYYKNTTSKYQTYWVQEFGAQ